MFFANYVQPFLLQRVVISFSVLLKNIDIGLLMISNEYYENKCRPASKTKHSRKSVLRRQVAGLNLMGAF